MAHVLKLSKNNFLTCICERGMNRRSKYYLSVDLEWWNKLSLNSCFTVS